MPKEKFAFHGPFSATLAWGDHESAQLAVETVAEVSLLRQLYGVPEAREQVRQALDARGIVVEAPKDGGFITDVVDAVLTALDEASLTPDGFRGLWTGPLSRGDLNDLIRAARRARNAVYGSDE